MTEPWENEDRDERGRWTSGGGGGGSIPTLSQLQNSGAIEDWQRTFVSSPLFKDRQDVFTRSMEQAYQNPNAHSAAADLLRATAAAKPEAPVLHRGMSNVPIEKIPKEGQKFNLRMTSFSSEKSVADKFASKPPREGNASVHITVEQGSRALNIDKGVSGTPMREWTAVGRYEVLSREDVVREAEKYNPQLMRPMQPGGTHVYLSLRQVG